MEEYRTEEEQVDALKKWWQENGRSIVVAIIVALGLGFGWRGFQDYRQGQLETASNSYQTLLQTISELDPNSDQQQAITLAEDIKREYTRSSYAQFAALHLARLAVNRGDLTDAEAQLRWVLAQSDKGSDTQLIAQMRLARVLASSGDTAQALTILDAADPGTYAGAYAVAKGDILLMEERKEEALAAYTAAMSATTTGDSPVNLSLLQQKMQSLSLVSLDEAAPVVVEQETIEVTVDTAVSEEE